MSDPIVGIDLGTSNSVVAFVEETGAVRILPDEAGYKIHPSVVSFHPNGGVVVGAAAKQRKVIDPKNTIFSVKRLIGRSYNSPEVQIAKPRMPYLIKEGQNQQPIVVTRGGEFAVPEVSAIILDHVRNVAAAQLQQPVNRAVVTVPASFNDAQRSATATAGAIAGLTVVRVLNEPTAAALAYGNTRSLREVIAVYDFGGGTFDITILKLEDQVYEVLGTAGDTFLGGDDLDERLVDRMVEKFLAENRLDLRTNEVSMMRLRAVAEQTKIELSRRSRAVVRVDEIAYGPSGKPLDLQIEITRDEFVRQVADLIDKTFPVCQEALAFANLSVDQIDDVILVGGTTKIPYVRDQVSKFFTRAPRTDVSPEDAVAAGAALQAASLDRILSRSQQRPSVAPPAGYTESDTETTHTGVDQTADQSITTPGAEYPVPQAPIDDVLDLLDETTSAGANTTLPGQGPRKRQTAGYPEVRARPTEDRPPQRGQHHDRFDDRTPTPPPSPIAAPIGRMTKTGLQTPKLDTPPPQPQRPLAAPPATPGPPKTTQPKFTATQPIAQPPRTPPAQPRTTTSSQPSVPTTQPRPAVAQPPATQARPAVAPPAAPAPPAPAAFTPPSTIPPPYGASPGAPYGAGPQAPTMIVEPPRPPPPRQPPPAQAATIMMEQPQTVPVLDLSPASTARGMGPGPDALDSETTQSSAASTAKGFQPPPPTQARSIGAPASPVVIDVTPRGLGVGTVAGFCEELIRRNSRVPTEIRKLFTTSRDGQDSVRIIVCQGESRRLDNNVVLGDLTLQNLAPRPRGETSIEVTFMLDASGILQVRARDAHTGREQRASLDLVGAMPQAEVAASRERMQQLRR